MFAFQYLSEDGRLILLARTLRTFGYGFLSVVLGLYLARLGIESFQIGALLTVALLGSAALTILFAIVADRWGRRRVLKICAGLMSLSGLVFAFNDNIWVLMAASLTGTISATSGEVGPFLSLEQAILPQTVVSEERTRLFAIYNLLGSLAGAFGALFSGLVAWLVATIFAGQELGAFRLLLVLYGLLGLVNLIIFARLSPAVERVVARDAVVRRFMGLHRSRGTVFKLSALFGVDALAGGLVTQSLVAYWLNLKFGLGLEVLGPVFFGANILSAFSYLAAERIAAKIGLINTMVFTHLLSNILLMLVPLVPTAPLAIFLLLVRQALSQMDVPTRQSYTMAVVAPDERVAAAGFTSVTRNVAAASSPIAAGYAFQVAALGLPFLLAGGLKIVYDLSLWVTFRHLKPGEEIKLPSAPSPITPVTPKGGNKEA